MPDFSSPEKSKAPSSENICQEINRTKDNILLFDPYFIKEISSLILKYKIQQKVLTWTFFSQLLPLAKNLETGGGHSRYILDLESDFSVIDVKINYVGDLDPTQ